MEKKRNGTGNILRKFSGLVTFLLCAGSMYAEETLDVVINESHPTPGQAIVLSVELPNIDRSSVYWKLPLPPDGLRYVQSPVLRNSRLADQEDTTVLPVQAEFIITLVAEHSGHYVFPEMLISDVFRSYTISSTLVTVYTSKKEKTVLPRMRWFGTKQLYTGQSKLYILQLVQNAEFIYPDKIVFASSRTGTVEEVFGAGSVSSTVVSGIELFTIPIVAILFTPAQQGAVKLPKVIVSVQNHEISSAPFSVNVMPLPGKIKTNIAIGEINFHHSVSRQEVFSGESIHLELKIEGSGNIPFVSMPVPEVEGLIETSREELNNYSPQEEGYTGSRTMRVTYDTPYAGVYAINIPPFYSMDNTETLRFTPSYSYGITIVKERQSLADDPQSVFTIWTTDMILANEPSRYYRIPLLYLLLLPGLLFLLLAIFRIPSRIQSILLVSSFLLIAAASAEQEDVVIRSNINDAVSLYNGGAYESALDMFLMVLEEGVELSGLHYNMALCYLSLEKVPEAIFELHRALSMNSENQNIRTTLETVEKRADLLRQIPVPELLSADIFFIALLITWNIGCVIAFILLRRKHYAGLVLFASVAVLLCMVSTALLVRSVTLSGNNIGIVRYSNSSIKRIPEPDTSSWLMLQPGLTVEVLARHENFYHIVTANGVNGWIEQDSLLYSGKYAAKR